MSLCDQVHASLDRTIRELLAKHAEPGGDLLDVGCWTGSRTVGYGSAASAATIQGIEGFADKAEVARALFPCHVADIESTRFPLDDESVDVVVCNQVLEHCKNIFLPLSEMWRVLKPGGLLIVSVPNLGSLHNRILLLCGLQPTSIRVFGPHVRGFTHREFLRLLTYGDGFEVLSAIGVGLYPFPAYIGDPLSRHAPAWSHTPVLALRRSSRKGLEWIEWLETNWTATLNVASVTSGISR